MLKHMRELQKRFTPTPEHTEELAKIEQIFNELKPKLECGGARLRCLLDVEKKLREEVAEENFTAGFALGWEIRRIARCRSPLYTHRRGFRHCHIRREVTSMAKRRANGEVSIHKCKDGRQIISSALKLARDQRLIANNPAEGCALPKLEHREMQTLTREQLAAFFREAKETSVFEMYYVELATGLRRGELLGLKWEDVDLEQGSLRVRRQVARINGEIVEAPLKTKNSCRTLPLAEGTVAVLKEQREKAGKSPWVFPVPTGGPMSPDSVLHMLHRVLNRAGLPHIRFHDLRHPGPPKRRGH